MLIESSTRVGNIFNILCSSCLGIAFRACEREGRIPSKAVRDWDLLIMLIEMQSASLLPEG